MLFYPALVVALGALWPLDWAPTRLNSLSSVTGKYHGTTWATAVKVTAGNGTDEELLVVEGNTSDEVAKNTESQKSCEGWFMKWCRDWDLVDQNGKFHWGLHVLLCVLMVIFGVMAIGFIGWGFGESNGAIYGMLVALLGVGIFIGLGIAMKLTNKW